MYFYKRLIEKFQFASVRPEGKILYSKSDPTEKGIKTLMRVESGNGLMVEKEN